MISMAETRKGVYTNETRALDQGFQAKEVRQHDEPGRRTLFRVALQSEDVIPCDDAGKVDAIIGRGGDAACIFGFDEIAVHEIETGTVGDSPPQGVAAFLPDLVPSHVRHLEPHSGRVDHCGRRKAPDTSRQDTEPRDLALLAVLEEHLLTDADAEKGLVAGGIQNCRPQATIVNLAHAVRHRPLAGKDDALGGKNHFWIGRNEHRTAIGDPCTRACHTDRRLPMP
jgi:hypothetical protein